MIKKDAKPFELATNAEWRARGVTAENWEPYELDPSKVPAGLRDLIPWVRHFGIGCDVTRHDFAEKMTAADREALRAALAGRHAAIEDFLYSGPPPSWEPSLGTVSTEQHAFQATLVLEMEECDGPGIAGYLSYALRKVRECHSPENVERLRHAVAFISEKAIFARSHREELEEARSILGEHS